jgi:hypothetical protein
VERIRCEVGAVGPQDRSELSVHRHVPVAVVGRVDQALSLLSPSGPVRRRYTWPS